MVAGGFISRGVNGLRIIPKGNTIDGNSYGNQILRIHTKSLDHKELFSKGKHKIFLQDGDPAYPAK